MEVHGGGDGVSLSWTVCGGIIAFSYTDIRPYLWPVPGDQIAQRRRDREPAVMMV